MLDALVIHRGGNPVGCLLHCWCGVAHGNAGLCPLQHLYVVVAVAECEGFVPRYTEMAADGVEAYGLAVVAVYYVTKDVFREIELGYQKELIQEKEQEEKDDVENHQE